jgi:hypothetical protein
MKTIALCLTMLLPFAAAAQMYKWIDEKGRTVYSETPPPDGKGAKVDIRPSGPAAPAAVAGKQAGEDARRERILKDQKRPPEKAQEIDQSSARRNNCVESQRRLQAALDDKDREREVDGWKKNVKKYCE